MSLVVCDDDSKINMLLERPPPCLKHLVHIKEVKKDTVLRAKKVGIELLRLEEVEKIGAANLSNHREKVVRISLQERSNMKWKNGKKLSHD